VVEEFTTTLVTLAPIPLASGSWAKALIAEVNLLPFCSRAAFCAAEVLELKNFSQFAVISATAPELLELAGADELLVTTGDEVTGAEAAEGDVAADVLELLLQAATATARAGPSARAMIRRVKRLNRMTRLLCLGRMCS